MEEERKHRFGRIAAMMGFVTIPLGGMAYSLSALDSRAGTFMIISGLAVFVAGVELAMSTHKGESEN
ncbi:MAG: hypothetical protein ABEK10_03270 [Candidatus Nanosalina sp.]